MVGCKGLNSGTRALVALLIAAAALGAFVYLRAPDAGGFRLIEVEPEAPIHDGFDTMGGYCDLCHGISAAAEMYPVTSLDQASLFCVTCHVPGVPRPDAAIVFSSNHVPGGAPAPHNFDSAGGQPPSSTRLILNSLGAGISVYQEDPYNPSVSGHKGMKCLNCHTAHSAPGDQIKTSQGRTAGGKILKTRPTRTLSLADAPAPLVLDNWAAQGAAWCLSCHPQDASVTGHNHPDYLCLQCHQDTGVVSELSAAQFPHTGNTPNLLAADPDVLCLSCHPNGSMP